MRISWLGAAWVAGCGDGTPLGVTLADGQVVVGLATTEVLRLDGVFGEVAIPFASVGVVLPVEAATLGASDGQVTVWLRNGSELRGRWLDPALVLGVEAGGETIPVELPMATLTAVQLRGTEEWPDAGLYRVRTSHGDDLLVDPQQTQLVLHNKLGTFSPYLSECASVGPVGDPTGDWRVVLRTGTTLVGPLEQETITLRLPVGPESLTIGLADLVSIDQQVWQNRGPTPDLAEPPVARSASPAGGLPMQGSGLGSSQGWFENTRLYDSKR